MSDLLCDLRARFTENAKQFDSLMVEMLAENDNLKKEIISNEMVRKLLTLLDKIEVSTEDDDILIFTSQRFEIVKQKGIDVVFGGEVTSEYQ